VNISVRPVLSGSGRGRARTSPNVNNDNEDDASNDAAAADIGSTRQSNRIMLNIDWSVRYNALRPTVGHKVMLQFVCPFFCLSYFLILFHLLDATHPKLTEFG